MGRMVAVGGVPSLDASGARTSWPTKFIDLALLLSLTNFSSIVISVFRVGSRSETPLVPELACTSIDLIKHVQSHQLATDGASI